MRVWIPALLWIALAGCAHSPSQTPADDAPPADAPARNDPRAAASEQADTDAGDDDEWGEASTPFDRGGAAAFEERDPWKGFNRKIFGFNEFVDRYAIKPAAKGYRWITPQWLDDTVTRFFSNLGDIGDSINYALQWQWGDAGQNLGRFTVNTTLGLAGLFDVASDMNLHNSDTNLDVTLGRWGVPSGPYLVLPIFGPSSVRDAGTLYPRSYLWPPTYIEDDLTRYGVAALYGVDLRADLLDLEKNIVGDRYTFIRNAYLQRRLIQIEGPDAAAPPLPDEDPALEEDDGWE
ncbi:VacJ family lipoprotein [Alloalcanivorax sp. C16-1]|uniref:MlaA family lipoprotein n=1 Tax=Alloalcanivorax sp. C16-1 TaxID=3390051 RepID=UPI003970C990